MAKKTLVIDGTDRDHFCLTVDEGTVVVGDRAAHPEGTIRLLKVVRIRCEVEVEEDRDSLPVDEAGVIAPLILRPGHPVQLKHAHLLLNTGEPTSDSVEVSIRPPTTHTTPQAPAPAAGPRRLRVTDGGDQGSSFKIPEAGTLTVGKVGNHADIRLHDLYVSKLHCSLQVVDGIVTVTHIDGANGTHIDGHKITTPQVLHPGSVLRVGNSHLRLEVGPFADEPTPAAPEPPKSGVLRAPAATMPAPSKPEDPLAAMTGQTLGHYLLGKLLGRGHTGAVYQATHTKTAQAVALKVLAPEFPATPSEQERFVEVVKTTQPVHHPNIVAVLGAGKTATHCWIARELIDGESAAAVIARIADGDKPSWTRAARVTVHLARALDCLHQHRLVHGNITPRNVLLQNADHSTRLTDLGLAQALEGSKLLRAVQQKKRIAELPYLAPEQTEPGGFVDNLADLHAVGALAYSLITGRPPFVGDTPAAILEQIRAGRIHRPSLLYRKVPVAFDAVVLRLLAHHQEDRYQTAAELLAELEPLAESHGVKL